VVPSLDASGRTRCEDKDVRNGELMFWCLGTVTVVQSERAREIYYVSPIEVVSVPLSSRRGLIC